MLMSYTGYKNVILINNIKQQIRKPFNVYPPGIFPDFTPRIWCLRDLMGGVKKRIIKLLTKPG
jgi:hypothetical protein